MRKLNATDIKKIAIIAMTIDHVAWILPNDTVCSCFMHVIGRITAPIMWFFVAEGCYYTKSWKGYFGRMLVFAVISHFAYCFYEGYPYHMLYTSVMWPLTLSILIIKLLETEKIPGWGKLFPIILLILCSIHADWGAMALAMPAVLYFCRHSFKKQAVAIAISGIVAAIMTDTLLPYRILQLYVCLSIPLLANYNKQRGEGNRWLFYLYYPLHLVILGIVHRVLIVFFK